MKKERGRGPDSGRSRAKESNQEVMPSLAHETTAGTCAGGREVPPRNALPNFIDLKKEPLGKSATVLGTLTLQ